MVLLATAAERVNETVKQRLRGRAGLAPSPRWPHRDTKPSDAPRRAQVALELVQTAPQQVRPPHQVQYS